MSVTPREKSQIIKRIATAAGLNACGIAEACPIGRREYIQRWLAEGQAGSMGYLHKFLDKRLDPGQLLPGAQSVIVVALSYHQAAGRELDGDGSEPLGRIAMYARGDDYHDVLRDKLEQVVAALREDVQEEFDCQICVDTAPVIEREWAAAAGLGWIGKNTLILSESLGSYTFLGVVVTTLELEADEPAHDHCGSCTACLDACPTKAFTAPYQMDASRCISYLTIENRGDISKPFQEMMGDWVFGCDVCQDVCPFNRKAPHTTELRFAASPLTKGAQRGVLESTVADRQSTIPLDDLLTWTPEDYHENLRGSAMKRAKLDMLKRNARIAKSNIARGTSDSP